MEFFRADEFACLSNSGITSSQLIFPENSRSERIAITRVIVTQGAMNPVHRHESSEQIWIALRGQGTLLLEGDKVMPFGEGDVVRFADKDLHELVNTGTSEFEYLSVTSPPVNFRGAYAKEWK